MYIVLELQTNKEQTGSIVNAYNNESIAHQAYYTALAAAAVSNVPIHSVVLLNEKGVVEKRDFYERKIEED